MEQKEHQHSYVKFKRQGQPPEQWFKCSDPHCLFTVPASLILGKASLCPECHTNEFILDREALRRSVPKCLNCRNTKEAKVVKAAAELVATITEDTEVPFAPFHEPFADIESPLGPLTDD